LHSCDQLRPDCVISVLGSASGEVHEQLVAHALGSVWKASCRNLTEGLRSACGLPLLCSAKADLKAATDPFIKAVLNGRQLALKVSQ
jgi:hypothetical protein